VTTYYCCSPMTGRPYHGMRELDAAAADLRARYPDATVWSPAELDDDAVRDACMADPTGSNAVLPRGRTWSKLLARDLRLIASGVDCIVVLPGWKESRGCRLEIFFSRLLGLDVRYYPSMRRVPVKELARAFGSAAAFGADDVEQALLAVRENL